MASAHEIARSATDQPKAVFSDCPHDWAGVVYARPVKDICPEVVYHGYRRGKVVKQRKR